MSSTNKSDLRKSLLNKRSSYSNLWRSRTSYKIQENCARFVFEEGFSVLMSYVSYHSEVETHTLITWCLVNGIQTYVPVTDYENKEMFAKRIFSLGDLDPDEMGILSPDRKDAVSSRELNADVVVCPGVGFDRRGYRLGYGEGYYDKFLSEINTKTKKIGLAFSFQILEQLPDENHDIVMDYVISEKEIIEIS